MKKNWLKKIIVLLVLIGLCGAGGWLVFNKIRAGNNVDEDMSLYTATEGHLTISITEPGTIKAREVEIIKSELEGRATVLWVIDEATEVKKGDKLIELDASSRQDEKITQEIIVQSAKTSLIVATEKLKVVNNQAKSTVEQAELDLKFAKMDLKKYLEGEYPNLLKNNEARIVIADEQVQRTKDKLDWSVKLEKEKYISPTELKSDELAWKTAKLDLELQSNQLALLKEYTYERTVEQLESDVKQATMAFERAKLKAASDVTQAEAELASSKAKYERQKNILEKTEEQISNTVIYSPVDGMVIYASSTKASWRSNEEPLDEGKDIREREELFYLPTANLIKVEANIHEANLDKIKTGSLALIKVDAIAGVEFSGRIESISVMPDAMAAYINPNLKLYKTEVFVDEESTIGYATSLRTGMGCQVEIISEEYEKCIYVPIQAVINVGGQSTVYVYKNGKIIPRKVEIGLDNNRMVRIISGLKVGEQVMMTPPLAEAEVKNGSNRKQKGEPGGGKPQGKSPGQKVNGPDDNKMPRQRPGGTGNGRPEKR